MSETSVLAWGDLADEECAMFEMAAVREVPVSYTHLTLPTTPYV